MLYSIPKAWTGETCVILAGGPSLRTQDISPIYKAKPPLRIIAINDSWRLAPKASVLYFCDWSWWQMQMDRNARTADGLMSFHDLIYKGFWLTVSSDFEGHPQVRYIKLDGQRGLSDDPTAIRHGSNSGYQAINVAFLYGAKKIILLGYDMKCAGARTHWHDEPRQPANAFKLSMEQSMLPHFPTLVEPLKAAGVTVINSTPDSALKCWEYQPLDEALK